jgi:hypothetical protein
MHHITLLFALVASSTALAAAPEVSSEVSLESTASHRRATLLGSSALDASFRPSSTPPLRLTDGLRFEREGAIPALDSGGGLSSDVRQILALILGFIPGFGIGHLIARDRDGFILFLIIDVALYVLWGVGWRVLGFGPFGYIGGVVWLVVHIIQALDAYASAGGPRIVQAIRERAVELADLGPGRPGAQPTVRAFAVSF